MPIIGAVVFTAGWFIAGRVEPGYNPRREYISSLSAADAHNPWIMIVAFVVFGLGVVALGLRLLAALHDRGGRAGAVCVLMSGVGIIVSGVARHDCSVQLEDCMNRVAAGVVSAEHVLHDVASGAVFTLGGLAQLMIAASARRHPGWAGVWPVALTSGAVTLVLFVLMNLDFFASWTGAFERALVLVAGICVCLLGGHLQVLERRPEYDGPAVETDPDEPGSDAYDDARELAA